MDNKDQDIEKGILYHRLRQDYEHIAAFKEKYPIQDFLNLLLKPETGYKIDLDKLFKAEDGVENHFNDLLKGGPGSGPRKSPYTKEDRERLEIPEDNEITRNLEKLANSNFKNFYKHTSETEEFKPAKKIIRENFKGEIAKLSRFKQNDQGIDAFKKQLATQLLQSTSLKTVKVADFSDAQIKTLYGFNESFNGRSFEKALDDEQEIMDTTNAQYVCAIITNTKGELLLTRRSWSAPWGSYQWSFPGGTVEVGENALEALIREVKEELGVDIDPENAGLILTVEDEIEGISYHTSYFVIDQLISEESIVLNFENDKYQYVSIWSEDTSLIPNLDVVFSYFRKINSPVYEVKDIKIQKSFIDLFDPNPYEDLTKGVIDKAKLHLKEITDKLGRRVKKWVRGEETTSTKTKTPKAEESTDYHMAYRDDEKVKHHAKNSSNSELRSFIEREGKNENAKRLVKIAKNELRSREKEKEKKQQPSQKQTPETDEEYKKRTGKTEVKTESKPAEPEKKKDSDDVKDHLDLITSSDNIEDLKNHVSSLDKDKKLSPEDKDKLKSEIHKQIGKLITEGKTFDSKSKPTEEAKTETKEPETSKEEPKLVNGNYIVNEKDFNVKDYLQASGAAMSEKDMTPEQKKNAKWITDENTGLKYDVNSGAGMEDVIKKTFDKNPDYKKTKEIQKSMNNTYEKILNDDSFRFAFVGGAAGLGKTFGLKKLAHEENIKRAKERAKNGTNEPADIEVHIPSTLTKAGFIDYLYEKGTANDVLVIDDKDDLYKDPEIINIMKTATNTNAADRVIQAGTKVGASQKKEAEEIRNELQKQGIDIDNVSPEQATPEVRSQIGKYKRLLNLPVKFNGKIVILSNDRMPTDPDDKEASASLTRNAHHYAALKDRGSVDFYKLNNNQRKMLVTERAMSFVPGSTIDDVTGQMAVKPINAKTRLGVASYLKDNFDKISQEVSPRSLYRIYPAVEQGLKEGKTVEQSMDKYFAEDKVKKGMSPEMIQNFENLILGIN